MSGPLGDPLEQGKLLDQATSIAILEELTQTVPRFRGSQNPSRVIWIAGLPTRISRKALINFWSRLGCVVDARPSLSGYAHVEFASTEEALRAVRQGVPHGVRYQERLLDVDFSSWVFYVGPGYRAVHIAGWPTSHGQPALLKWTHDIPNIAGATVLPPFRGEKHTDPRSAFLRFTTDATRAALHMLDGRAGLGGKMFDVGLSWPLAVDPDQLWWWVNEVEEDMEKRGGSGGEGCLEDQWGGLG